jgi:hypothetical protein
MNEPAMVNTIPGVIVSCAETFFGHRLDDLSADRKRIVRDLLSSYLDMPIPAVNNTFRLWPRATDSSETNAIRFSEERQELDTVISMMLEPEMEDEISMLFEQGMEDEIFPEIPKKLLEKDREEP